MIIKFLEIYKFFLKNSAPYLKLYFREQFKYIKTKHSFHLVDPSPWPFVAGSGAFFLVFGGVLYMHKFLGGYNLLVTGFFLILFVQYTW